LKASLSKTPGDGQTPPENLFKRFLALSSGRSRINPCEPPHHPEKIFSRGAGLCFFASPFSKSAKPQTLAEGIEGREIILLKASISKIQQNSTKAPERIEAPGSAYLDSVAAGLIF
jgi:hypothetical protein